MRSRAIRSLTALFRRPAVGPSGHTTAAPQRQLALPPKPRPAAAAFMPLPSGSAIRFRLGPLNLLHFRDSSLYSPTRAPVTLPQALAFKLQTTTGNS